MPVSTQIRTARLLLRPLRASDRLEYLRVRRLSEEFHRPWLPRRRESFEKLFLRELEIARKRIESSRELRLVGFLEDGRIAGFFQLSEIVRGVFHNAYAGWSVNVEVARQGYGAEGVQALLDVAFSTRSGLGLHRVQANIIPSNRASIRLARRVGFRREGRALRYLQIAGEWQDHFMYAKTAEEHALKPGRSLRHPKR